MVMDELKGTILGGLNIRQDGTAYIRGEILNYPKRYSIHTSDVKSISDIKLKLVKTTNSYYILVDRDTEIK